MFLGFLKLPEKHSSGMTPCSLTNFFEVLQNVLSCQIQFTNTFCHASLSHVA
jgi:hypothetical protein